MAFTENLFGTLPSGSCIVAVDRFIGGTANDILLQSVDGSYVLWTHLESGRPIAMAVILPADCRVRNLSAYAGIPGLDQVLLQNSTGSLLYASYFMATASFTLSEAAINFGMRSSVAGRADYNIRYSGDAQVLLESTHSGTHEATEVDVCLPSVSSNSTDVRGSGPGNHGAALTLVGGR